MPAANKTDAGYGRQLELGGRDLISQKLPQKECKINLYGIVGKDVSINTEGMVYGILMFNGQFLDMAFHLVDRKYVGMGDGYLGFDFMSLYKTFINLDEMYIEIQLKDTFYSDSKIQMKIMKWISYIYWLTHMTSAKRKWEMSAKMNLLTYTITTITITCLKLPETKNGLPKIPS